MESDFNSEILDSETKPSFGVSAFNRVQGRIAARLREAANKLSAQSHQGAAGSEWSKLSGHAQDWMQLSADRIEQIDPRKVRMDFENNVRRNPGKSLLIAGAAGLLLGAVLRRR